MNRPSPHAALAARRPRRAVALIAVLGAALAIVLTACTSSGSASVVGGGNQIAQTEYTEFTNAVPYPYAKSAPSDPLERKNLAARLKQYNSSGDTNYVYLFGWGSPSPIGYYVIRGKVSSTSSQMTSTQYVTNCDGSSASCTAVDAIGDDGSYGPEEGGPSGVFFFTTTGTLIETDQPFVVSSAPIKLYASVPQLDAPAK